jgi:hypothetical protein
MTLWAHLPSGRLKNNFGKVDETKFQVPKAIPTHFFNCGYQKKRLGIISLSDVFWRMALRTHNLPSGRIKNDFREVDEAMLQGFERPYELILCILDIEKSNLHNVA